jgi:hypothetical protein
MMEEATELEFLRYFYNNCDFGPAHEDIIYLIKESFVEDVEKRIPEEYRDKYLD